jgi:hypothetical protein
MRQARSQRCALVKPKQRVPEFRRRSAERLTILAVRGSAAIEFRCGGPRRRIRTCETQCRCGGSRRRKNGGCWRRRTSSRRRGRPSRTSPATRAAGGMNTCLPPPRLSSCSRLVEPTFAETSGLLHAYKAIRLDNGLPIMRHQCPTFALTISTKGLTRW